MTLHISVEAQPAVVTIRCDKCGYNGVEKVFITPYTKFTCPVCSKILPSGTHIPKPTSVDLPEGALT